MKLPKIKIKRSQIIAWALLFIGASLLTCIFYSGLDRVYFQQDEWFKTGKSIYYTYSDFGSLWTKRFGFHYYPLLNLYFIAEYLILKLNIPLYMYVGVILQGIVGVLLYVLFKKLFENKIISLLLVFLFLINPSIHQVNLNEMVSSSYKIPLILMLSSFIVLYDSIRGSGNFSYKGLVTLSIIYLISVAFFEGALIMIVLLPLFYLLFKSKKMRFGFDKRNSIILVSLIVITAARLILQNILPVDAPLPIEGSFIVSTLYNAGTTPFKFVAEYILNVENIHSIGRIYEQKIFALKNNPNVDHGLIAVTTGYEMATYLFVSMVAIVCAFIVGVANRKAKNTQKLFSIILFSAVWLVINAVVIAPQGRIFNNLESRYLYISGVGVLMIVGSLLLIFWDRFSKNILFKIIFILSIVSYLLYWISYSQKVINQEKKIIFDRSVIREKFIREFKNLYPTLPKDAVIYVYCIDDCTSNERIGLRREWVVPFQNGLGWVLLIVYAGDDPKKYAPYFSNYLFWDNKSAGYRKIDDTSFGFFTDFKELKKTMKENSLVPADIMVIQYKSNEVKLIPAKNAEQILFPENK